MMSKDRGRNKNLTLTLTLLSIATSQASQNHQQQLTRAKVASTSSLHLQQDLYIHSLVLLDSSLCVIIPYP